MIARVVIDSPLPHLDRPFDYAVPEALAPLAVGTRVRVPFAGRLASAVVVGVSAEESARKVKEIRSAAALPSFSAEALELARAIATRYAGSLWDVLRLMGPPRVASVEQLPWSGWGPTPLAAEDLDAMIQHALAAGLPATPGDRAVWASVPTEGLGVPARALVGGAVASIRQGGTAIIVAPDGRAVAALVRAAQAAGLRRWTARTGGDFAVLDADDGPTVRYGSYLAALRGVVTLVIGTRHAAWQPVPALASITVWDEASSTMAEPRAPYPHARTVAAMRAAATGCALLVAGHALSADAISLAEHGFARRVDHRDRRNVAPRIDVVGDDRRQREGGAAKHWMPGVVWGQVMQAAHRGVAAVVVPQSGYATGHACARCGTWAECQECGGDLARTAATAVPTCTDCGTAAPSWHCPECREHMTRPVGLGVDRLAGQVARMAPGTRVIQSSATAGVVPDLAISEGIVVATPGALPAVQGGYGHIAIVGARVSVTEGLGAEVNALRRWFNAAALGAGRDAGRAVSVVGEVPPELRRALISWDGWSVGESDFAQRAPLGLPPHRRALRLEGTRDAIATATAALQALGADTVDLADAAWVFAGRGAMQDVTDAARAMAVQRSASSEPPLYVRVDATPSG